jgi:hypothetical protein
MRSVPFPLFLLFTVILAACSAPATPTDLPEPTVTNIPDGSPAPARLEIAGAEQTAGIGTYCWTSPTVEGGGVSACVDKAGLPTPQDPLIAASPITARLTLPLEDPPSQLHLSVFPAADENEVKMDGLPAGFRFWMPAEGVNQELALQTSQEINLELEPGLYVFYVFSVWEDKGDVSYGFLVEVQ